MTNEEMIALIHQLQISQERFSVWAESIDKAIDKQDKILDRIQSIADAVRDQANIQTHMAEEMKKIRGDVDEIKHTPVKRWELVVTGFLTGIIGILAGYFSNIFGLKNGG